MKIFQRKDEQVKKDALSLSLKDFIEKYSDTAATELVLKSVYTAYNKGQERSKEIAKIADTATSLVDVSTYTTEDDNGQPKDEFHTYKIKDKEGKIKKTFTEVEDISEDYLPKGKRGQKVVVEDGAASVQADKKGRTPRMRELIKELGKDKAKIKVALEAEGFNCAGSGFHSEWNRISKS